MKVTYRTIVLNWIFITVVLVVGFTLISAYISITGLSNANRTSEAFKSFYLEENKNMVKQEVLNQIDSISYEKQLIEEAEFDAIEHEITHLSHILLGLEIPESTDISKQQQVVLAFEEMADFDKDHLYFVVDSQGHLLRSGTDDTIEGLKIYDAQDINGVYYTREILKAMEHPEGIFVTYSWPKVKDGPALEKTSFCFYIPEYDIIVGTGIYHEDIEAKLKENVYERIQNYNQDRENYIFLVSYKGISLVQGGLSQVGDDMTDVLNLEGQSIHDEFMEIIINDGGGFGAYRYHKKNNDKLYEKVSFVAPIEGWDTYLGVGFYTEDLVLVNDDYDRRFKEQHYTLVFFMVVGLLIIGLIIFVLIQRGSFLQAQFMQQEEIIFTELFKQVNEGIIIIGSGHILYSNDTAKKYFSNNIIAHISNGELIFQEVENKIGVINNDYNDTYYVECTTKPIQYNGCDSLIYFIKNVTDTYRQANNYLQISQIDELTELPNRRALQNDFSGKTPGNACLMVIGIIDLDHFKAVNDTFGHKMGDDVLKELSLVFKQRLRKNDKIYRYGGEEFLIVIRDLTTQQAKEILMEINKTLQENCRDKFGISQTFSGGLVAVDCNKEVIDIDDIVVKADKYLYEAKSKGRNRIEC